MNAMIEYHRTKNKELQVTKDLVKNIIKHGGEDGRVKEALLIRHIRSIIPQSYSVGSGFIVHTLGDGADHQVSQQIDVIINDNRYPMLFSEGDFIITTPDAVRGIIEIKTNVVKEGFSRALKKANDIGSFVYIGRRNKQTAFFNGIFSYEGNNLKDADDTQIQRAVRSLRGHMNDEITRAIEENQGEEGTAYRNFMVNHVAFNDSLFLKHHTGENRYSFYLLEELAYSYFISNLVYTVSGTDLENSGWLWFPEDKETRKLEDLTY